jgi:SAM-dependent methyltransferase
MDLNKLYAARFPEEDLKAKDAIWQVLCSRYFQSMIRDTDTVMDLGAGYGEFLRHIQCQNRIAVEMNPDAKRFMPPETRLVMQPSWELSEIASSSVDAVFASNFFEHLPSKDKLLATLAEVHRVLVPEGRLLILQPNLAYLHGRFFDFLDHHLPLTHVSMAEALALSGFKIRRMVPRFLPFTTRTRLPQSPWLVRLYLLCPPAWRIMGKQMFILAGAAPGNS